MNENWFNDGYEAFSLNTLYIWLNAYHFVIDDQYTSVTVDSVKFYDYGNVLVIKTHESYATKKWHIREAFVTYHGMVTFHNYDGSESDIRFIKYFDPRTRQS